MHALNGIIHPTTREKWETFSKARAMQWQRGIRIKAADSEYLRQKNV